MVEDDICPTYATTVLKVRLTGTVDSFRAFILGELVFPSFFHFTGCEDCSNYPTSSRLTPHLPSLASHTTPDLIVILYVIRHRIRLINRVKLHAPSQAPKFWFLFGTYRTIRGLRILTVPERLG